VSVSAVASAAAGVLPSGCTALSIGSAAAGAAGAGVGYAITSGGAVSAAVLTTAKLTAAGAAQLAASGVVVDCIQLNAAGQFVARLNLAANAYNAAAGTISCALPAVTGATYIFVASAQGAASGPVQTTLGTAVAVAANFNSQIQWGSQVALSFSSAAYNSIGCSVTSVG
jgi:hypothetical protein